MTEDVDPIVEAVEVDAVRPCLWGRIDCLDELHCLGVKHGDGPTAGESVTGLRVDRGTLASHSGDLADRIERIKIEDSEPRLDARFRRSATRDVQAAPSGVGIDVVP